MAKLQVAVLAVATLVLANGAALAQAARASATDPLGIVMGSFLLSPSLTLGAEFNDNIFAEEAGKREDLILTANPAVSLQSDWGRHALTISAASTVLRYLDNTREDAEDLTLTADGRIDVLRDTNIILGAGIQIMHEDRGSPEDVNGEVPTEFMIAGAQAGLTQRWNRVSARVDGRVRQYDYDDVPAAGATINNDDRDRTEFEVSLRGAYEIQPGYEAFVEGRAISRSYDDAVDDAGFLRDSDGYNLIAGIGVDLTGLIFGNFFAGYWTQDYDDTRFGANDNLAIGAELTWIITPLTTLNFGVTRTVEETTVADASSFTATRLSVTADHELLRNLLLNANVSGTRSEWDGINRTDDTITAGFGATYVMNRYLHLNAGYTFTMRDSDFAGFDYDRNSVIMRAVLQF